MPPGALTATEETYICVAVQVLVVESNVLAPGTVVQVGAPPTPVCKTWFRVPTPLPSVKGPFKVRVLTVPLDT